MNPWDKVKPILQRSEIDHFYQKGFLIRKNILSKSRCELLKEAIAKSIETDYQRNQNKYGYKDFGMVLVSSLYDKNLAELPGDTQLMAPFNEILGTGCILYAYTSSSMPPGKTNYSRRIHVDSPRFIPNYITNMGATILLDKFNVENGATQYLPKSHLSEEQPTTEYFDNNCISLDEEAGTIFYFNARLWHRGGVNKTDHWRHALTFNVCRPWMKQRIDIPQLMGNDGMSVKEFDPKALQKLGFMSQTPQTFDEYYAPQDQRSFSQQFE